jgi:plasmid stability protein
MPAIHVRNVDDAVIAALKARARKNHRSLQGEVKSILEDAASSPAEVGAKRTARRLQLRTVRVGSRSSYSRDVIYDDDER